MGVPIQGPELDRLVRSYRATREAAASAEQELFRYIWEPLQTFVRSITNGQGATDPALSTTRRFFENLEKTIPDNSKAFLFQIARNRVYEEWRKYRREEVRNPELLDRIPDQDSPGIDSLLLEHFEARQLELIQSMPEPGQSVVRDWIVTQDEELTAKNLGYSRILVTRALNRYQKLVLDWLYS